MIIFDFIRGRVVDTATDPEAAQQLLRAAAEQARSVKVAAGGAPTEATEG
jgi:hypothetical protein